MREERLFSEIENTFNPGVGGVPSNSAPGHAVDTRHDNDLRLPVDQEGPSGILDSGAGPFVRCNFLWPATPKPTGLLDDIVRLRAA